MDLDLVPIYFTDERNLLERLSDCLAGALRLKVRGRNPWFDPERSYDRSRGQYNSTVLLKMLLNDPTGGASRVLGVTGVDLFTPVLTYVFGEAQLEGRAAVVSVHRLRPEVYGLAADEELLYRRLETEAVHELGHTFGLLHCAERTCVMGSSTYAEEIDLKSAAFCRRCLEVIDVIADTRGS